MSFVDRDIEALVDPVFEDDLVGYSWKCRLLVLIFSFRLDTKAGH